MQTLRTARSTCESYREMGTMNRPLGKLQASEGKVSPEDSAEWKKQDPVISWDNEEEETCQWLVCPPKGVNTTNKCRRACLNTQHVDVATA